MAGSSSSLASFVVAAAASLFNVLRPKGLFSANGSRAFPEHGQYAKARRADDVMPLTTDGNR